MKRLTAATVVALALALAGCAGINTLEQPTWAKDAYDNSGGGGY
jgi:hypothetical protein